MEEGEEGHMVDRRAGGTAGEFSCPVFIRRSQGAEIIDKGVDLIIILVAASLNLVLS